MPIKKWHKTYPMACILKSKGKGKLLNNLAPEARFETEELWGNEQLPFKRAVKKIVSSRQRVLEQWLRLYGHCLTTEQVFWKVQEM